MNNTLLNNIITANQINSTGVSVVLKLLQQPNYIYVGKQLGFANDIEVTRQCLNIAIKKLVKKGIIQKIQKNNKVIGIKLVGGIE
jgi:predicted transcriptional regulator